MTEVSIIGLDLAKNVFQAHGAAADGSVVFRRKLRRSQVLGFLRAQPRCVVAMEACATVSIGTEPGPPIGVQSGPLCRHEGGTAGVVVAEP